MSEADANTIIADVRHSQAVREMLLTYAAVVPVESPTNFFSPTVTFKLSGRDADVERAKAEIEARLDQLWLDDQW